MNITETTTDFLLRLPSESPPPLGKTMLLLTWEGTIVKGRWDNEGCCAWAPLPKETPAIKRERQNYWMRQAKGVYGGRGLL